MANTVSYGFIGLEHLFDNRVDDSNISVVRGAIDASLAEHNRQVQAAIDEFIGRTTDYQVNFRESSVGTMQPLDEWGNPMPTRWGSSNTVAFPIQGAGTAWGDNRVTRALMTVEEVNEAVTSSLLKDADWMKRHIMAALLDKNSWTFTDDLHGSLTIQPLANGDTATFIRTNGTSSTDNHYIAQAAAIADATNPFDDIYDELREHPVNAGKPIVAYVPSNVVSAVEGLANFYPVTDPEISFGADTDRLGGSIDRGLGDEVLGRTDRVWIVEWSALPDNYIIAVARGTDDVLKMREYPAASLQGLFLEDHSSDGNLMEHRMIRYAGFGAHNRVGALCYFVSAGDTTYDVPSGYATPLPV